MEAAGKLETDAYLQCGDAIGHCIALSPLASEITSVSLRVSDCEVLDWLGYLSSDRYNELRPMTLLADTSLPLKRFPLS